MNMKGLPNRDSNPVPPSQWNNHAINWAYKNGKRPKDLCSLSEADVGERLLRM